MDRDIFLQKRLLPGVPRRVRPEAPHLQAVAARHPAASGVRHAPGQGFALRGRARVIAGPEPFPLERQGARRTFRHSGQLHWQTVLSCSPVQQAKKGCEAEGPFIPTSTNALTGGAASCGSTDQVSVPPSF